MKATLYSLLLALTVGFTSCKKDSNDCESAYFNLRLAFTWDVRALDKLGLPHADYVERYNQMVNLTNAKAYNVEGCEGVGWKEIPIIE